MRARALPPWTGTRVALPPRPRVGTFVSRHPRPGAFEPLDPDQPCADWMRARALPPWTGPGAPCLLDLLAWAFAPPAPHDRHFAAGLRRTVRRSIPSRS